MRRILCLAAVVLGSGAVTACASAPRAERAAFSLSYSARELTDDEQVTHVLSRLTFGPRPGDPERVAALGVDRWIERQLHPESIPDTALTVALRSLPFWTEPTAQLSVRLVPSSVAPSQVRAETTMVRDKTGQKQRMITRTLSSPVSSFSPQDQFFIGKLIHAQLSERQLFEVIVDFWENHFSLFSGKLPSRESLVIWDRDVVRPHALGKFRDLLGAVAHSPAMLFYLDNQLSTKDGINENYARELLELHTLGVDGGYTQADVIDVARALTGWASNPRLNFSGPITDGGFIFNAAAHDSSQKVVLGHTLAAGRGIEDGEQVLDILARHPSTARFIAYKLARRLVADDPPPALVDRAAAAFTRSDGDITAVVRTILLSDDFFARAAFRAKVKTPFDLVVSARRAFNAPPDTTAGTVLYLPRLGQRMFGRQSPDGWPERGAAWMNAGAITARIAFANELARGGLAFFPIAQWEGWMKFGNAPVEHQANGAIRLLLGGIAPQQTRVAMLTTAGDAGSRFRDMIALALATPEFQRR